MIAVKISTSKIDKAHLYEGKSGKYLDILLFESNKGPDQFGNDGFVVQAVSKEAKAKGVKGPIIGNWKHLGSHQPKPLKKAPEKVKPDTDDDDGTVPF